MCGLLETFWSHQQVIPIHNGYYWPAFPAKWVTTQGVVVSLTLFNVDVYNVIRTWLAITLEE